MPIFELKTNLASNKIPANFLEKTVDLVAKTLG